MKKNITNVRFAQIVLIAVAVVSLLASCASSGDTAEKPKKSKYEPQPKVNLDEWTYYKPITVFYQTNNGRSWGEYHNYRVYSKKLTKGYRYVVGDINTGKIYEFAYGGTGKYKYVFNNGKETCYFNCEVDDPSRIVHITHQ